MGDYADDAIDAALNECLDLDFDEEDYTIFRGKRFGNRPKHPITCNRCLTPNLYWEFLMKDGSPRWVLYTRGDNKPHTCTDEVLYHNVNAKRNTRAVEERWSNPGN